MFKKMLIMKLEDEAKKNPAKAEQMFGQLVGKYKELSGADKTKAMNEFNSLYDMAKSMKCDNVVKYMNKFKKEQGV